MSPAYRYTTVSILGLALFFTNLGGWDLWDPDEPRYAQVAREMRQSNEWILPHLNGMVYVEKPPFFFWLTALSQKLFNKDSAFSNRLPSALAALLTTLVVFWLGTRLFNERTGYFAALVLATNAEFFWLGHRVNLDTTLTLLSTAAAAGLYAGIIVPNHRLIAFGAAGFFAGLGFLTKLYGACVVPGLALTAYILASRQFEVLKDKRLWLGLIVFLITVFTWLIPALNAGGFGYLSQLLYHRTATMFLETVSHAKPFYYYLESFPVSFLPWFLFFPSALALLIRPQWRKNPAARFVLAWFVVNFVFFSIATGKRNLYLLPLYPAASLMVGFLWDRYCDSPEATFMKKVAGLPLYGTAAALALASLVTPVIMQRQLILPLNTIILITLPLIVFAAGGAVYVCRQTRQPERAFYGLMAMVITGLFFAVLVVFPAMNSRESAKPFGERVASIVGSGDRLAFFRLDEPTFIYYTGFTGIRRVEDAPQLERFFSSYDPAFCIMKSELFQKVQSEFSFPVAAVLYEKVADHEYVLLSNRTSEGQQVSPLSAGKGTTVP